MLFRHWPALDMQMDRFIENVSYNKMALLMKRCEPNHGIIFVQHNVHVHTENSMLLFFDGLHILYKICTIGKRDLKPFTCHKCNHELAENSLV